MFYKFKQYVARAIFIVLALLPGISSASEEIIYFHNDISGSPMVATDASGNVLWKENYRPYGDKLNNQAASGNNNLWFTGKPYDGNTGLSYMGARYYDPMLGRFMGIDPKGFDEGNIHSFNRYAYGNNSPYKFVDPDGRDAVEAIKNWWDASVAGFKSEGPGSALMRGLQGLPVEGVAVGAIGAVKAASAEAKVAGSVGTNIATKEIQAAESTIKQVNPKNLIPTQARSEMSGSQIKRLEKDMRANGFDQAKPVDAVRRTDGRLEIQDGHHRVEAAKRAGIDQIPVQIWEK